jgi:hypothetical protein
VATKQPIPKGIDAAVFQQILNSPALHLSVIERDGAVVATTYLTVTRNITRSASPYAAIEDVVVDEKLRGAGLVKQIRRPWPDRPGSAARGRLAGAWHSEGCGAPQPWPSWPSTSGTRRYSG